MTLEYGPEYTYLVRKIRESEVGRNIVNTLDDSNNIYTIETPLFGCEAKFDPSVGGGTLTVSPNVSGWINTIDGGFALASPDRVLLHELGHAYNYDQKTGPMFDKSKDFLDRPPFEEQHVIDNYGNKYGDGIERKNHDPACPTLMCR